MHACTRLRVFARLARRDVHSPLPAVAQDGELDARRAEHGRLDGGKRVDGHSVHGEDQVALEQLPVRRRPRDEPLHRQHLPLLLLARDEPLRPRAAQAKPRAGHRAARHTQRDGAQLRVEQVQAAQRRRRAERPALARVVAARRAALLPRRLRDLGASGEDREERLGRHALELLVELVLVAAAVRAPKGLHLAALVDEDSSDGVLRAEDTSGWTALCRVFRAPREYEGCECSEYGGRQSKTAESVSSRALVGRQEHVFRF